MLGADVTAGNKVFADAGRRVGRAAASIFQPKTAVTLHNLGEG